MPTGAQRLFQITKIESRVVYLQDCKSKGSAKCIESRRRSQRNSHAVTDNTPISHLKAGYLVKAIVFEVGCVWTCPS